MNGRPLARLALYALLAGAACNPILGIDDVTVSANVDGRNADAGGGGGGEGDTGAYAADVEITTRDATDQGNDAEADADAEVAQPNAGCLKSPPASRGGMAFQFDSNPALTTKPLKVTVTDNTTGFTNVNITICTPTSGTLIVNKQAKVESGNPPYAWSFDAGTLPPGISQIGFRADPGQNTLYANALVEVR